MNEHTIPAYIIRLPHQDLNYCKIEDVYSYVSIADKELKSTYAVAEQLKDKILQERKEHTKSIEKIKREYEELALKLENEHQKALKQFQKAIEENKKYHEWYGTLISPILIIKELWNNGTIGELDKLIPPNRWRVGNGLSGDGGKTAKRYWLSQLEEWGLIKTWGKGFYMANVGMYEALEVLNKMMKKQNIIKKEKEYTNE